MSTPKPDSETEITAYVVYFDAARKIPHWSVALHGSEEFGRLDLTALSLKERHKSYLKHPCKELTRSQANQNMYRNSGWNAGHLTPARNIRWSLKASRSVNLFVNLAPQDPITNQQVWETLESQASCSGKKLRSIIATGTCKSEIDKMNSVSVPKCFWKMLCYVKDGDHHVVGFLADNRYVTQTELKISVFSN